MKAAEAVAAQAKAMTETQLQSLVIATAKAFGYRHYHTHDSRRSPGGFPDLVLVHTRVDVAVVAELKRQNGRYRPGQQEWLADLNRVPGITAYTWRPLDFYEGHVEHALRTHAKETQR